MQFIEMLNIKRVVLLLGMSLLYILVSVSGLYGDTINPDGVNWHKRSEQFVVALKSRAFENTYQHYHPGITLMWVTGPVIEIIKQLSPVDQHYNSSNFLIFDYFAKISLVLVQLILVLCVTYVVSILYNQKLGIAMFLTLTLEPFFLGNLRLMHMDTLFSLFLFLGLALFCLAIKTNEKMFFILSGVILSLSFLTKSIGIGALVFVLMYSTLLLFVKKSITPKYIGLFLITSLVAIFLIFPAMWVAPITYISKIFAEASRVGVRTGHQQIFFGEYTQDPGITFYPIVLLIKFSPFVYIGIILYILSSLIMYRKNLTRSVNSLLESAPFILSVFYVGYIIVMTISSKKLDRYMLPLLPYLVFLSSIGYNYYLNQSRKFIFVIVALFSSFVILPVLSLYPYYFTYTSPLFGSSQNANSIVGQKPFGIGVNELKSHLISRYGKRSLGFIDTKPIESIYPNSQVFDIRTDGVKKYDLLVLAINEEFPEKVVESKIKFRKSSSLYINGLEYWRIYAKENR